ncbi:MAG: single-stranded DNA-binding protein [Eubacterium sp.]|nr:single-stranded DNA-binding protein [Eubacterium sp.]
MNKIILMGYLSKDPELQVSQGEKETKFARFDIAVNRRKNKNEADFFHCTAFGKMAEFIEKYFHKGSRMLVSGRMESNDYTNKNGEKVYGYQVLVEEVEFGEKASKGDGNEE